MLQALIPFSSLPSRDYYGRSTWFVATLNSTDWKLVTCDIYRRQRLDRKTRYSVPDCMFPSADIGLLSYYFWHVSRTADTRITVFLNDKEVKQSIPLQAWTGPEGFRRLRLILDWHMKVVRLSALCTGRLYPPENIPGTHFCERLSQGLCNWKIPVTPSRIEPATFRLVALAQQTAPPCAPFRKYNT